MERRSLRDTREEAVFRSGYDGAKWNFSIRSAAPTPESENDQLAFRSKFPIP